MGLTKKGILDKTHYGLSIFSFILRKYYPGEIVLKLSGRNSAPTKNPFNGNSKTMMIAVIDGMAQYKDTANGSRGDVFDFASRYFKCVDERLLLAISNALSIGNVSMSTQSRLSTPEKKERVPLFSVFKHPITNVIPWLSMSLYDAYCLIKSKNSKTVTDKLRSFEDKKEARKYKAMHFYYATFSGVFDRRTDSCLVRHSGLLTIDLDNLEDVEEIKKLCLKDKELETQLLFVSPGGAGIKWVVSIDILRHTHKEYFESISNYLSFQYGLSPDTSGKDVSRACFLPYDPQVFINPII